MCGVCEDWNCNCFVSKFVLGFSVDGSVGRCLVGGCCMGLCEEWVSCWVSFSFGGHSDVGGVGWCVRCAKVFVCKAGGLSVK